MSLFFCDTKTHGGRALRPVSRALLLLAWLIAVAPAATAQEAKPTAAPVGDPALGRSVAEKCAQCHGPEGVSEMDGVPHLAGQFESYLLSALNAYRTGARGGEEMQMMAEVVSGLSAEDMANVAAYYGSLPRFTRHVAPDGEAAEMARQAAAWDPLAAGRSAAESCTGCHGEHGDGALPGMPELAGQPKGYLISAMAAYMDGSRKSEDMQAFLAALDPDEFEAVAEYYSHMKPARAESAGTGDPFAGRSVAEGCGGCHGEDGNAKDSMTPRLAGLDEAYLAESLQAYKEGLRSHPAMQEQVKPLGEADMANVSAFYASAQPKSAAAEWPMSVADWVERCDRCHGEGGNSSDPRFPILAGQSRSYLAKALKLYHGGDRDSSMMFAMSYFMSGPVIEHLATYYAGQTVK